MTAPRPPRETRDTQKPWLVGWMPMACALAFGAGLPLLWAWWSADAAPAAAAQPIASAAPGGAAVGAPTAVAAASPSAEAAAAMAPLPLAQRAAAGGRPRIARQRDPNGDPSADITDFINEGEVPTMADVIARLRAAGVTGGLAAFNPPGTKAALVGIAVAPDAELPAGYVRHHQFTDDGRPIEPILMFAPEHPLVVAAEQAAQAAGQPALRPEDRVVPPALVPPGLPVRQIVLPPAEPGKPGN